MPLTKASKKRQNRLHKKIDHEKISRAQGILRHKRLRAVAIQRTWRDEWK